MDNHLRTNYNQQILRFQLNSIADPSRARDPPKFNLRFIQKLEMIIPRGLNEASAARTIPDEDGFPLPTRGLPGDERCAVEIAGGQRASPEIACVSPTEHTSLVRLPDMMCDMTHALCFQCIF
jgi:hypothetical protein